MKLANLADALRLLRTTQGLTQTAVGKLDGAPDFRTLSHWETRRKNPGLRLLTGYLDALGLDFHDLQDALDTVTKVPSSTAGRIDELADQVDRLGRICEDLAERRQVVLELRSAKSEALAAEFAGELASLTERLDAIERHFSRDRLTRSPVQKSDKSDS